MLEIKRVLYPTDFSECARHALPHTLHLAATYGAELHLLHALVLHESDPGNAAHRLPSMEELYRVLEQQAEAQLRDTAEEHGRGGFAVRQAQLRGISAAGAILDYSAENDIDLIVMGTHGRRGLRRLLLGSVAEEVMRLAPCPVLTVPEKSDGVLSGRVQQIVVPVDFSEHSRLALGYAGELAALYDARLDLLHIVDEVVYPDFYPPVVPPGGTLTEDLRKQSVSRLQEMASQIAGPVAAEVHVRAGRAAPEIAEFAETRPADLIVLASHGLTGIRHMLLGSVTEQVLRRAPCPVFAVKTYGKSLISK